MADGATRAMRDADIIRRVDAGESSVDIARSYWISRERVRQIYERETGANPGRVLRPATCKSCGLEYAHKDAKAHTRSEGHEAGRDLWRVTTFWSRVAFGDGCWEWQGVRYPSGYGHTSLTGLDAYAHRTAYQLAVDAIPPKMTIDHLCENRACVRPDHLEVVTSRENTLRSPRTLAAINASKTHCPQGHEYAGRNLILTKSGRLCRTCTNARQLARHHAKKAVA